MNLQAKNRNVLAVLAVIAAGMVGMSFAAVPLYRIFCQVTGFGGTVRKAEKVEASAIDRTMRVRFTANVDRDMPWQFQPKQKIAVVKVGEPQLATYEAYNPTSETITGTAVFNVTPFKAGPYFDKIQCFCFTEQTLGPGERKTMPVTFFVDPSIAKDKNLDDVTELVLSYTFYVSTADAVQQAAGTEDGADGDDYHRTTAGGGR
jgi:cytochrome c oxidase assembly protein subunit 11